MVEHKTSEKRAKRRELKAGEFWCLYSKEDDGQPQLIHNPGPHFESNAKARGNRICVVKLTEVKP